jgi:hypothetical protein
MDWVFSQDRRSFHGKTTVDVNRSTDGGACLFTFVTDGKTVVIPVATIPPLPGQAARSASRSPAAIAEGFLCYGLPCFGLVGPQPTYGPLAQCFAVGSANYVQVLQPLQVLARNANPAVVELDWVGFRYRIHYGPDQLTALTYLTNSGAELGNADGFVYASPFYWAHVTDYPPLLNPAGVFLPGADALQYVRGDNARFRDVDGYYPIQNLPHGYYFVVYDIVWYTRNGINGYGLNPPEWGWLQIPVAPNGQFCVN